LPGTPVLRYGDEIGMGDDLSLPERNCARTPMQWSTEPHAGFTAAAKAVRPVISGGAYGFEHVNVAAQRRDPDSLLNWTERALRMRQEIPEVSWGDFKILPQSQPSVLVMRYDWRNNTVLFVHNLLADPQEIELKASAIGTGGEQLTNLLSEDHSAAGANGRHCVLLEPFGYRWFRVGGLDYLLKRSDA